MNDIPRHIMRPARYLGTEPNRFVKEGARVRFALCYPDAYEIGMSYYGFFLLYEIANTLDDVWCERAFAPWTDMEAWLRETGRPLATLESGTPLSAMDLVGFSLTYELNVTNVLNMLDLAGIPLEAAKRERGPIIVGGGPLMLNPSPFESFFDLIVVGEADDVLVELLERMKEVKGRPRGTILEALCGVEGVYSPVVGTRSVRRRYVADLDRALHAVRPPVPLTSSVHDRFNLEISRGCGNGCRFCMAGYGYRPYRERGLETLGETLLDGIRNTGYEEVSLLSLSSGDYSHLFDLIALVRGMFPHLSLSLPSLKIGSITEGEIALLGEGARGGFTFALEAATADLRTRLNKNIEAEALIGYLPLLKRYGWRSVKLYLMTGFPWETEDDLRAVRDVVEPIRRAGINVNLSVSPFTPKPHTPFQWLPMEDTERLRAKTTVIKESLRRLGVNVRFRDTRTSRVEALIARGDARLNGLFSYLHRRGVRLEAWSEFFDAGVYDAWIQETGIPEGEFLGARSMSQPLPWDFIDTGVDPAFLREERELSEQGEYSVNCLEGCRGCGLGCTEPRLPAAGALLARPAATAVGEGAKSRTYTLRYRKCGASRYIGHLDAMNLLLRALRAAGVRLRVHGRYHPKPRISLSPAIPVGVESTAELAEIEAEEGAATPTAAGVNAHLPGGMKVLEVHEGTLKELSGECSYLLLSKTGGVDGAIPWRNGGERTVYLWKGSSVKDLWSTGSFERIVKVEDRRLHGIRTDH